MRHDSLGNGTRGTARTRAGLWSLVGQLPAVLVATTALVLCATVASAQDDRDAEAKALFQAGREAFDAGRYDAALDRWQEAYEISGRSTLLYNVGLAADRLRQDDKALDAFTTYLHLVPSADNRDEVEQRIRALEKARNARQRSASAPSPAETAGQASTPEPARAEAAHTNAEPSAAGRTADTTRPITKQWWFWTGLGAAVVGGVVIAIAASSGGETQGKPFEGRTGLTVMTLRAP